MKVEIVAKKKTNLKKNTDDNWMAKDIPGFPGVRMLNVDRGTPDVAMKRPKDWGPRRKKDAPKGDE